MTTSIFPISSKYFALLAKIEAQEGELQAEDENILSNITEKEYPILMHDLFYMKKSLEGEIEMIDLEMRRLGEIKGRKTKAIDKIKENTLQALKLFGEPTEKGFRFKDTFMNIYTVTKSIFKLDEELFFKNNEEIQEGLTYKKVSVDDYNDEIEENLIDLGISVELIKVSDKIINKELVKEKLEEGKEILGAYYDTITYPVFK